MDLTFHPLTPDRWSDFERLFGARGACGGCWCMSFRLPKTAFDQGKGEPNRLAMKALVDGGTIPGILAYDGDEPIGWCSVAPREEFPRLERSRTLKPIDGQPVWSVVCFFVTKPYRRKGVSAELLKAAVAYVGSRGGRMVEGYPVDPAVTYADAFAWVGIASAFQRAGFTEVARPSDHRVIMRAPAGSP